jgi:hypothetical protein
LCLALLLWLGLLFLSFHLSAQGQGENQFDRANTRVDEEYNAARWNECPTM